MSSPAWSGPAAMLAVLGLASAAHAGQADPLVQAWDSLKAQVETQRPRPSPSACPGASCEWYDEVDRSRDEHFRTRSGGSFCAKDESGAKACKSSARLDVAALHNRQYQTRLVRQIHGRKVWLSGLFSREPRAFTSVLIEGFQPMVYDSRGLAWKAQRFRLDGRAYKLSISPDFFDKMRSRVWLESLDDPKEAFSLAAQEMFDAYMETFDKVPLKGRVYHVLSFDAVNEQGRADASLKTFEFVYLDEDRYPHLTLIPAEKVPRDVPFGFKLDGGRTVGLALSGGMLEIYEN